MFSGQLTTSFAADNSLGVEEAWFQGAGLVEGGKLARRPLPLRRSATSTSTTRTPGTSSTRRSRTRRSSAARSRPTACSCAGSRRPIASSRSAPRSGAGTAFPGSERQQNGIGSATLFAHVGDDIGTSAQLARRRLAACTPRRRSALRRRQRRRHAASPTASPDELAHLGRRRRSTSGRPNGNATPAQLQAAGRVLPARARAATLTYDTLRRRRRAVERRLQRGAERLVPAGRSTSSCRCWRVGAALRPARFRHAAHRPGRERRADRRRLPDPAAARPSRTSLMFDCSPSEFSRLRLQLARDRSRPGADRRQVFLQYIMSLGAHGAHTF